MDKSFIQVDKNCYVVKDKLFQYRLTHPIKNEDGKLNWFNLLTGGSWGNLLMVIVICAAMVGLVLAYKHDVSELVACCNKGVQCINDARVGLDFSLIKP